MDYVGRITANIYNVQATLKDLIYGGPNCRKFWPNCRREFLENSALKFGFSSYFRHLSPHILAIFEYSAKKSVNLGKFIEFYPFSADFCQ